LVLEEILTIFGHHGGCTHHLLMTPSSFERRELAIAVSKSALSSGSRLLSEGAMVYDRIEDQE
jgi:hypothetical protein